MDADSSSPPPKRKMRGKKRKKVGKLKKLPVSDLLKKTVTLNSLVSKDPIPPTLILPEAKIHHLEPIEKSNNDGFDGEETNRSSNLGSSRALWKNARHGSSDLSIGSFDNSVMSESSNAGGSIVSMKDLISEIEKCELRHRPPPDFVTPLAELSPVHLSWNHKLSPQRSDDNRDPRINIIGCLHPVQLILAKADKRIRKQRQVQEQRDIQCQKKTEEINHVIEWKTTRAERYAKFLALQQLQAQWLRIAVVGKYLHNLRTHFLKSKASNASWNAVLRSANRISKYYFKWYRKHLLTKLSGRVTQAFDQARNVFRLYLRIYRKRKAVRKIQTFLNEYRNHHKMNVVVHRYLQAVRRVQAGIREFLRCKSARIEALCAIWDKIEYGYIKKKLEQKRERMKSNGSLVTKKSSKNLKDLSKKKSSKAMMAPPPAAAAPAAQSPLLVEDDDDASVSSVSTELLESKEHSRMLIEMKHQARNWQRIDEKMETMIVHLRHAGVIQEEKEEDTIAKLVAPKATKLKCLRQVVEAVRREFYLSQRAIIRERIRMDATFSERHALDLLRGNTENIDRIVNNKFGNKSVPLKFQPLYFYKRLDRRRIFEKIKETHQQLRTFHIAIDHHWK